MTLEDKLRLTFNSKEDARLAINEKGVITTKAEPFNSYPDKIRAIDSEPLPTITLKNEAVNGDFSNGLVGWDIQPSAVPIVENNQLVFKEEANGNIRPRNTYTDEEKKDTLYVAINIAEITSGEVVIENYHYDNNGINLSRNTAGMFSTTARKNAGNLVGMRRLRNFKGRINYVMEINLSKSFGAGNEPLKEEMDEVMEVIGYFEGEKEVVASLFQQAYSTMSERTREIADVLLGGE